MSDEIASAEAKIKKPNIMKRLYNWVIKWADTAYGEWALFIMAFAESSFFPIPPDTLLIPMCLSATGKKEGEEGSEDADTPKRNIKCFRYALTCTIASVLGGLFGYYIGFALFEAVGQKIIGAFHYQKQFADLIGQFNDYSFWGVFIPALTPIPYKIFTIASGVAKIGLEVFIIASVLGRGIRFFAVATLMYIFGAKIKNFIEKYFNILSIVFTALLIGGFLLFKLLMK